MSINIDSAIFIIFLIVNLVVGLYYSKGTKTIREYAVGNRNFSTATIAATLVATWIGGGFFSLGISKTYSDGLGYIVLGLGEVISFFVISYLIAPRSGQLLGSFSIAEALGNIYGKNVRIITAIFGLIRVVGTVAIQFKVSSIILNYFFGMTAIYSTLVAAFIVIIYSACGGIRAVTYTDVIQFSTFTVFIPILAMIMWGTLDNPHQVIETINQSPLFDYSQILPTTNAYEFINYLCLILLFITPGIDPAIFQRIAMSKNVAQVQSSFIIASFAFLAISLVTFWVAILLLSTNSNLNQDELILYIVNKYPYIGLKGFLLAAIMAMIMSTADSYINAAAILFAHDVCKPLNIKTAVNNELSFSRASSVFIGVFAVIIALSAKDLFQIILGMASFYMPVVTVPLLLTIFGFRSSQISIILGITAGFMTTLISIVMGIDTAIVAVSANLISLAGILIIHHLLKVNKSLEYCKANEDIELITIGLERKRKVRNLIRSIQEFNLWNFCKNNTPKQDYVYSLFGLFCIISVFSTMYSIPKHIQLEQHKILEFIYHTVLISSSILLTFPIWPSTFKQKKFIIVAWNIMLPYILVFAPTLLIIVSNFGQFQLMIFMINMIIIALLLRWKVALFTICLTVFLSVQSYKWYMGSDSLNTVVNIGLQFKIMYALLLISSVLIAFLKPKQEYQELTQERNNHLAVMIKDREEELGKAQELKHEFLRNLEHEVNTPLVGLTSLAPMVLEDFDRLSPQQMKKYVKTIVDSHERYKTLSDNLLDLSKLDSMKYKLSKAKLNLGDLLKGRLDYCSRLYLGNKELEFVMDIDPNIIIECDEHYIASLVDNLIINAIKYSKEGTITLKLHRKETAKVEFQIIDEGIGIPQTELHDIFGAFVVSSKTRTLSGGRGIGLALCKKIVEVHAGSIKADSDGEKGAAFIVELPMSGASESKTAIEQERDILPPAH